MNKYNAMRQFRQFSLIGCRRVCHAPGAAHTNLSNSAIFQILSIFSPSIADSAFFYNAILHLCICELANHPPPVIIGQMPFQETPALCNDNTGTITMVSLERSYSFYILLFIILC